MKQKHSKDNWDDSLSVTESTESRRTFVLEAMLLALAGSVGGSAMARPLKKGGQANFHKFFTQVIPRDKKLQRRIFSTKKLEEFARLAVDEGNARGLRFTLEDVIDVMKEGRKKSKVGEEITDEQLSTLASGGVRGKGTGWCDGTWDHTNGLATDTACCPPE